MIRGYRPPGEDHRERCGVCGKLYLASEGCKCQFVDDDDVDSDEKLADDN